MQRVEGVMMMEDVVGRSVLVEGREGLCQELVYSLLLGFL